MDLKDISLVFVGKELKGETDEVISFLNACFYNKDKLIQNKRWVDLGDEEWRKEIKNMGNFADLYMTIR